MATFLNKLCTKVIFSEANELNLTIYDMGESGLSATIDDPPIDRLKTATGTVASASIVVGVTVDISIVKTSNAFSEWVNRFKNKGWIGGTCTIYDDINTPYTIQDVSLRLNNIPAVNGTEPAVTFQIQGNLEVNQDILNASN